MICSDWPSAWELWVCRPDKNQGWVRYRLCETHQQAKNVLKRVEGEPLEFKIVPLFSAASEDLPSNAELTGAALAQRPGRAPG